MLPHAGSCSSPLLHPSQQRVLFGRPRCHGTSRRRRGAPRRRARSGPAARPRGPAACRRRDSRRRGRHAVSRRPGRRPGIGGRSCRCGTMRAAIAVTVANSSSVKKRGLARRRRGAGRSPAVSVRSTTACCAWRERRSRDNGRCRDRQASWVVLDQPERGEAGEREAGEARRGRAAAARSARSVASCASRPCSGARHRHGSRRPRSRAARSARSHSRVNQRSRPRRPKAASASSAAATGGTVTGRNMKGSW